MATHKSAKKRARQALKRRLRNRQYISGVRSAVKSFKAAVAAGEGKDALVKLFTTAQSALSKAAQKGLLHSNNASRSISRLAATMKRIEGAATATKATTAAKPAKKSAAKKTAAPKRASKTKTSTPAKKAKVSKRK